MITPLVCNPVEVVYLTIISQNMIFEYPIAQYSSPIMCFICHEMELGTTTDRLLVSTQSLLMPNEQYGVLLSVVYVLELERCVFGGR